MPETEILFVLSTETDEEFKNALDRLAQDFPHWAVFGIERREEIRNGQRIPVGVIKIKR